MFTISETARERVFTHDDFPALTLDLRFPCAGDEKKNAAIRRFNAFYAHLAREIEKHAEKLLLPLAAADFERRRERSRPFREYRMRMTYTAREDEDTLYIERTLYIRNGGAEGNGSVYRDIWDADGWFL